MVINYLDKLFVTNDAATILKETEVAHPAAKLLVMASTQQEEEMGDNTNFVLVFAGELLKHAQVLLKMGLKPSEVVEGFEIAFKKSLQLFEEASFKQDIDFKSSESLKIAVKTAIASKQYGLEDLLSDLVARASVTIMPSNIRAFNVDSIRVVKILGGSVQDSLLVKGMVFNREPESDIKSAKSAKVAVFACPIDISKTETKGTVLIHNASEMLNFSKDEEKMIEAQIKEIADSGVKVIVTGGTVGDLALHFINRYDLLVVRVLSKFDLRRLCKVVGATPLARLGAPLAEEAGFCDLVHVTEIGSDRCTVFKQDKENSQTVSIVLRGSTLNLLDDLERAIEDGVNIVKVLTKDTRLVAGAGASEIEVAGKLAAFGETVPGLAQYSIKRFAAAFEAIPRTLAENAGLNATEVLSKLYAAHQKGLSASGVDIESEKNQVLDAKEKKIFDVLKVKLTALTLATDAALTVLRIDTIVLSKPAGGPKTRAPKNQDEDD